MGRFLAGLGRGLSWLGNAQTLWALLPAGVFSTIGGVSAYLANGIGWALFIASGVFCFIVISTILIRENYRANRLEHKLAVTGVHVIQYAGTDTLKPLFRPGFGLTNHANFELFCEVAEMEYVFGIHKGGLDKTTPLKALLAPRDPAIMLVPGFNDDVPLTPGRMLIRVKYGREKDTFTHEMVVNLDIAAVGFLSASQGGSLEMTRLVKTLDYRAITHNP